MTQEHLAGQQLRKKKVAEEHMAAKERYMNFWKEKLSNIYTEQAQNVVKLSKQKQENKRELTKLEEEEIRLMQ